MQAVVLEWGTLSQPCPAPVSAEHHGKWFMNDRELPSRLGLTGTLSCHAGPHSAFKNSSKC